MGSMQQDNAFRANRNTLLAIYFRQNKVESRYLFIKVEQGASKKDVANLWPTRKENLYPKTAQVDMRGVYDTVGGRANWEVAIY